MPQPILIRIHKKTLVPTKRQIKHHTRSDWKIKGKIDYEDSEQIFFVLGGLIKTDAQFAKALFDDFGPGEYMCIYWRKGMKGFRNFIIDEASDERFYLQKCVDWEKSGHPFIDMKGFDITRVPLNRENFHYALLSSGSIPMIMPGVRDIADAPDGVYRDGGVIDYHLDIPFLKLKASTVAL